MGTLIPVPYMGTSKPENGAIYANGLVTSTDYRVVYYNGGGNNPPLYYGRVFTGGYSGVYMSYSRNAVIATNNSPTNPPNTYSINSIITESVPIYYRQSGSGDTLIVTNDNFDNFESLLSAFKSLAPPEGSMNIKYSIQNGSVIGPGWISPNGNVTAYVTMEAGFNLTQQDISVTRNGTAIPFAYTNGVLTFTAPSS